MSALRVTVQDLHSVPTWAGRAGFCARGARQWAAQHGMDWATLVRDGADADALLATGDALAAHLVQHARDRAATAALMETGLGQ
jgi:hypothetical protein